ncbi:hypothetical protein [Silvimonas sp.]|nr:hypothetical protein [Silvimonas sp.]MDR3426916.1 hypothetical protein [Silvimonas sp.]
MDASTIASAVASAPATGDSWQMGTFYAVMVLLFAIGFVSGQRYA